MNDKPHPFAQLVEIVTWNGERTGRFYWQWNDNSTNLTAHHTY